MPATEPRAALAVRLRDLRRSRSLTQAQLAEALKVSVAAISSWESETNSQVPTDNRISELSTFYASDRSLAKGEFRLLGEDELTPQERAQRDELAHELRGLRTPATVSGGRIPLAAPGDAIGGGTWYFPDQKPIRVICGKLSEDLRAAMPYTDVNDPDYTSLYNIADLDALLELYGHLRAINPSIGDILVRTGDELSTDDLTCHLVVLGGVDFWDSKVRELVDELELPVTQVNRGLDSLAGYFEVSGPAPVRYAAELVTRDGRTELRTDVAHFYRGPNPYNRRRTVTICNGMFSRGTYGAVRALTDARFRDRNEAHLSERFGGGPVMSLLMRVQIPAGLKTVTPDWTVPESRLHEWP